MHITMEETSDVDYDKLTRDIQSEAWALAVKAGARCVRTDTCWEKVKED